jgi:hypothetical protein
VDLNGKFALAFASLSCVMVFSIVAIVSSFLYTKKYTKFGGSSDMALGKFTNQQFSGLGKVVRDGKKD